MVEQVVSGCYRVRLDGVNAYLVDSGDSGFVLIDTGTPLLHPRRLLKAIRVAGGSHTDVRNIFITHQHIDHAGGLKRLAEATGASVHVHALDAPEIEGGQRPRRGEGRTPVKWLVARSSRMMRVGPARVDHYLVNGGEPVSGIRAIHTPGHTAGHTAFLWREHGGVLFAGDAVANWWGRLGHAPIAEDWTQVDESLKRLARADFSVAAFGHGPVIREDAAGRLRRFVGSIE